MSVMDGLEFLTDDRFDSQIKLMLLQKTLEEERFKRDAAERKRWWQSSPVVLAVVGILSVFASGAVAYIQSGRTASDTLTLKQLEAQLDQQTTTLKEQLARDKAAEEAARAVSREMQEFEYKIVDRLLEKTDAERAGALIFLVRAGMVHGLDKLELEKMASPLSGKGGDADVK